MTNSIIPLKQARLPSVKGIFNVVVGLFREMMRMMSVIHGLGAVKGVWQNDRETLTNPIEVASD